MVTRILLVDDDVVDRKTLLRHMRSFEDEFEVVEAVDGLSALECVQNDEFDCILLDFRLPDLDGLEVLRRLAPHLPDKSRVPVVMLTGEGSELVAVEAMKSGAEDYLPKDNLTSDALWRAIANATEKTALRTNIQFLRGELERLALFDVLTGLGNRNLFQMSLDRSIALARRNASSFFLFLMDLDGFKRINDVHGHQAGDAVLTEIGRRLEAIGRREDSFFRLGGDEFAFIMETGATLEGVDIMARRILEAVSDLIVLESGATVEVGISIGIAKCLDDAESDDELVRKADIAMYAAKRGHAGVAFAASEKGGTVEVGNSV